MGAKRHTQWADNSQLIMITNPRIKPPFKADELETEEVDAFPVWEVFTQKKESDAHTHAGSLSAPNALMAANFAREHYGQDQVCCSMWLGLRDDFKSKEAGDDTYELFVQWNAGDRHVHVGQVKAASGEEAKGMCQKEFIGDKDFYTIWTLPHNAMRSIDGEEDMIWRSTDQSYRLAKGYSKIVRKKWDAIRASKDVDEYQKEDLKDTF